MFLDVDHDRQDHASLPLDHLETITIPVTSIQQARMTFSLFRNLSTQFCECTLLLTMPREVEKKRE